MSDTSFELASEQKLKSLLEDCHSGQLQLPDFQREWVWDEDRIVGLLDSVIREFPIGTLMILDADASINFKPRQISGRSENERLQPPRYLLMDGQQRMTSLYQAILSENPTQTKTNNGRQIKKWFYVDIKKCLSDQSYSDKIVFSVPEDKSQRKSYGEVVIPDLSTDKNEYGSFMFPISKMLDYGSWRYGFEDYWLEKDGGKYYQENRELFRNFEEKVLREFSHYQVPIIFLNKSITKSAVCIIFEKVNTGGKTLDVFELLTAMYASEEFNLREDWYGNDEEGVAGRKDKLVNHLRKANSKESILFDTSNTDFLQAVSLLYTLKMKRSSKKAYAVSGGRKALLDLPLKAYKSIREPAQSGFLWAAKFLYKNSIFRSTDIPYQTQVVSLAAILSTIGKSWEQEEVMDKLNRWYWCGVFGELYSAASETQIVRDVLDVPAWIEGGAEPPSVSDAAFKVEKLMSARRKNSAIYKGVNVMLMKQGAKDFRTGQPFEQSVFFDEDVNVHHVFPINWCKTNGIDSEVYNSIINRTPISARTNTLLKDDAPSDYLGMLEKGSSRKKIVPVDRNNLDSYIESHLMDPKLLRENNFEEFMSDRKNRLTDAIRNAMGVR